MYLRRCHRAKDGKRHAYWALVKSVRTAKGPRQEVVAYLGDLDEAGRLGVQQVSGGDRQPLHPELFSATAAPAEPRWVEVDLSAVRVERTREFGGPWLALQIINKLGLRKVLDELMPAGREDVPWAVMAMVLVICRLCDPSSELRIAEHLFGRSALADLLGVASDKVNDDRLYRALDALLPHKQSLEKHLKQRLGELFDLKYDLLLYDVTSTYFEGQAQANPQAQRGYSRDNRADCKQVCIALVVSRCGMPVGYELFAGNKADVTTVQEVVTAMEDRYGKARRVWVMDRGMVSAANIEFLKEGGRQYIVGTPRSMLRKYEKQLMASDWDLVHEGLEVKRCTDPDGGSAGKASATETFILCRSADRRAKEKAMHERFEKRIEEGLSSLEKMAGRRSMTAVQLSHRVGRLMGQNTRAAGGFKTEVTADANGRATLTWERIGDWQNWASLSEGCYLLRSNVSDWSASDLWRTYMQLSEAEGAFRIHKSDLSLRPVWHQKQERVQAHVLVCFLAYVLWKTLSQMCKTAGLGDEPRKVLDELATIQTVDVVLPTRCGLEIRKRCVAKPTEHQAILLHRLGLTLPRHLEQMPM
ncbi:MAG TPA: IS1634 family transposase [Gemmataceae bacterium]|nr:IS1634 family transposase [Gemmataceae bacterium]